MNHAERLQWNHGGQCTYMVLKKSKCQGIPGYSGGCSGRYTDDYGSPAWCSHCGGSGILTTPTFIRVPQFDAPKPAEGWVPNWIEEEA